MPRTCHCTPTRTILFLLPKGLQSVSSCSKLTSLSVCNSVYVRNLEERVKPEILTETLRTIFSEYGNIIDIVAKTNLKAKGQAFIVFENPESAQAAIDEVQGFEVFDKPMQLALARTRSDATVARAGNEEELDTHKRRRLAEKGSSLLPAISSRASEGTDR